LSPARYLALASAILAGCVSVRVETPCADSETVVNIPHVGVRTCSTSHDTLPPQPKKGEAK
jgi:hypothetical protein